MGQGAERFEDRHSAAAGVCASNRPATSLLETRGVASRRARESMSKFGNALRRQAK